jgi:hypothetical protein
LAYFTDKNEQKWVVEVNVGVIKKLKNMGVDILSDGEGIDRLINDPVCLCESLFIICKEQCKDRNLNEEEFYSIIVGDVLGDAALALSNAIVDFFPKARREVLKKSLEKNRAIQEVLYQEIGKQVDSISTDIAIDSEELRVLIQKDIHLKNLEILQTAEKNKTGN